ncbi:MAG TPA: N-acetyl-gamma-glutamyl-phosphate reductase [Ignavibacteriaceae bacterium]|nr:N-acetyl-gamma-glutamyl-phosphate reductase [Ignavibacteriaceae bacterium]
MISIGIIGGSGYTGKKLVQFCSQHPFVKEFKIYGFTTAGQNLLKLFPDLKNLTEDSIIESADNLSFEHDAYFIALPHGEALKFAPILFQKGKKIIDLGGDYRLNSADEYLKWYNKEHTSSWLLKEKVYGLADYCETDYNDKNLIANPGCYPTAALLGLLPMVKKFGSSITSIGVSAYSGTSGAGKTPKIELMMSEMDGNVSAYNLNKHRHQPEIEQALNENGFNSQFSFATHLLPVAVGIYSTSFIHLKNKINSQEIIDCYKNFYKDSLFVRLRETPPNLSWVVNSNFCDIHVSANEHTAIVVSAIDNLIKGASGQAVQNLNKAYGWDEGLGIFQQGVKYAAVY